MYIFLDDYEVGSLHFVRNRKDLHIFRFYTLMWCGNLDLLSILVFYTYHKDFLYGQANIRILADDFLRYTQR